MRGSFEKGSMALLVYSFAAAVYGAFLLKKGLQRRARVRRLQETPLSSIKNAPQGLVSVQGYALSDGPPMISPTGSESVFWEAELEREANHRRTDGWKKILTIRSGKGFYIADGTGIAEIRVPAASNLPPTMTLDWETVTPEVRENFAREASRLGETIPYRDPMTPQKYRYRIIEKSICPAEPLFVRASFSSSAMASDVMVEGSYERFLEKLVALRENPSQLRAYFDRNSDQLVSETEFLKGIERLFDRSDLLIDPNQSEVRRRPVTGMLTETAAHGFWLGRSHRAYILARVGEPGRYNALGGVVALILGSLVFLAMLSRLVLSSR